MSTITTTVPVAPESQAAHRPGSLRRTTLLAGLASAAATTALAAAAHALGVSFEVQGEVIPLLGFAQMTLIGAILGGGILAVLNRRSASARRRFRQVTVALTALSCIPSIAWPDDTPSAVVLVALHVIAAVIVVPALDRHATS